MLSLYSCAAVDKISTDVAHRAVVGLGWKKTH